MAKVRVELNSPGMRQLLNSGGVARAMRSRAEKAASAARARAPFVSGAYASSINVREARTDRAVARVHADVPYATIVEARHGTLNGSLGG